MELLASSDSKSNENNNCVITVEMVFISNGSIYVCVSHSLSINQTELQSSTLCNIVIRRSR